jgi:hypothetical protein
VEEIKTEINNLKMELAEATATLIKLEQERKNSVISKFFNTIGGVSGLLSIAVIVYSGGKLVNRLDSVEMKVALIERDGSRNASEYIAANNQWKTDTEERIARMETSVLTILPALPRIEAKLDSLKETLDDHRRNSTKP